MSTRLAASMPMAQSAVSTITWAVPSMRSKILMPGSPSSTSRIMLESWVSPTRQGTHLPQVWARQRSRKFSAMSTGHSPGGLAAIRRSMFRYSCSTTAWAWPGVFTSSLLILSLLSKSLFGSLKYIMNPAGENVNKSYYLVKLSLKSGQILVKNPQIH